ncbi:hypothetical protein DL93DRAFT_1434936 [Clavulina sp. PMI_390]|nr:hypothetical protein DL93DRAFT_1434936 [Clavulina sp. PMI_390]
MRKRGCDCLRGAGWLFLSPDASSFPSSGAGRSTSSKRVISFVYPPRSRPYITPSPASVYILSTSTISHQPNSKRSSQTMSKVSAAPSLDSTSSPFAHSENGVEEQIISYSARLYEYTRE